jgi:hypothetical protein
MKWLKFRTKSRLSFLKPQFIGTAGKDDLFGKAFLLRIYRLSQENQKILPSFLLCLPRLRVRIVVVL